MPFSGRSRLLAAGLIVAIASTRPTARTAQAGPSSTTSNFTVFLRTNPIGSETVTVTRTDSGWTIASLGRVDVPIDTINRALQAQYTSDWSPVAFSLDATLRGQSVIGKTTVEGTTARTTITQGGQTVERTDTIAADTLFLPTAFWAPFEALSRRLRTAPAGSVIPAYSLGASFPVQVGPTTDETLQIGNRSLRARRTAVTLATTGAPLVAEVWGDEDGRLMRVNIPAQNLEVVRDDVASVAVRHVLVSRAGDQEIRIPANGFRLAGTLSKPANAEHSPLVILVGGGAGLADRDETLFGVPIFGQLSGMLADAGFMVLRYDRRAIGQSGGRAESATLTDYADDLLAVVSTARKLPGVDRDRVAVVGHADGGAVAMLAASRQKDIGALGLVASMGTTGAEQNLWQATHSLERSKGSPEERAVTLDLQKRIQAAVITGSGWDNIPPQMREQADSPWFKSFLTFDPAKVMPRVAQPVLIVHGLLDTEFPPSNADRLEAAAKLRKDKAVEVVRLAGINHLLLPATTGEANEYAGLNDKHVSPAVATAIADWLTKTFSSKR